MFTIFMPRFFLACLCRVPYTGPAPRQTGWSTKPLANSEEALNVMAAELFELYQLLATLRSRRPSGPDEPSESEFVTLAVLSKEQPLTIGEVQKRVGVLPAQMSRIVRSLEKESGKGFVACMINAKDRRRIDVSLTDSGRAAHENFRAARLSSMHQILSILSPEDRLHLMRIVRQLRTALKEHHAAVPNRSR